MLKAYNKQSSQKTLDLISFDSLKYEHKKWSIFDIN